MLRLTSILLVLVACRPARDDARSSPAHDNVGSKAVDDCQAFVDKAWHLLPEIAPTKLTPGEFLTGCRKQAAKGLAAPGLKCIAAAADDAGVRKCLIAGQEEAQQAMMDRFVDDVRSSLSLKIRYAARTDNAADGTNSTYFNIVEDERLFVVTDAVDPAESKRAAEAMSPYPPAGCTGAGEAQLACAVDRARGASSIGVVVIGEREAYVVTSGDVVVLHRRGTALSPIAGRATLALAEADTLVLASRALRAAAGDAAILRVTPARASPVTDLETGIAALLAEAGRVRGHGPLSTIFVHLVADR